MLKQIIYTAILYSCQCIAVLAGPTSDNFMGSLSDNLKLKSLALLGSHDSGTYALDSSMGISPDDSSFIRTIGDLPLIGSLINHTLVKSWSQTQTRDITNQLMNGIRYFDLRVVIDPHGQFRTCHGLYGPFIADILTQLNNFLNTRSKEIVFLDFGHLFDQNGQNMSAAHQIQLINVIQQALGSKIAPSSYGVNVTLGQMHQSQKQVIIFWVDPMAAASASSLLWSRSAFLSSNWYNVTSWSALQSALNQGMASQPTEKFTVNQAILTPDSTMIVTHLWGNLLSVEANTNTQLLPWYAQKAAGGMKGNILMVDNEATISQQAFQISLKYNSQL